MDASVLAAAADVSTIAQTQARNESEGADAVLRDAEELVQGMETAAVPPAATTQDRDVDPFALLQSVEEKKNGVVKEVNVADRLNATTVGVSSDAICGGNTDERDAIAAVEKQKHTDEKRSADGCGKPVALKRVSVHEPDAAADEKIDAVQEEEESDEQRVLRQGLLRAKEMELFQNQLEKEMLKRRPDHFIIGVICRSLGGVPAHMRSSVWKELLGVARSERLYLDQSILQVEEDLENQKVISADAIRTRGNDPYFKQPETVELVTKILTYYCKCRNIRYKQGMNEVLAPFLILERDPPMPEGIVFQCFYAMIDKFLPQVFVDREFKSLQCSFQLYRLLMLYHDPKLCHYLDQHDMTPELYVTPWFMTLFARNLQPELVFMLWDFFLLEEDPFLMHFVAYAMVAANKEVIMSAEIAMLPQVLSSITLKSRAELEAVCEAALALSKTTPRSFERDLYSVCYGGYKESMLPYLRQLSSASSMQVYPDELVENLMQRISAKSPAYAKLVRPPIPKADDSMNPLLSPLARGASFSTEKSLSASSVFFIVLDCRPVEQYRQCHLSLSYHIDPEVVGSPDALSVLLKGFSRMKGCHFCFVGPAGPSPSEPKSNNIAFDTISRLARNISGEKKLHVEVQPPPLATASSGGLDLPTSPGFPGGGANDIISREQAGTGARKLHYEHISVTRLVLMFLQKGFEHISRLDGGFDELKKEIVTMDTFTQEQLLVHAEPAHPPTSSSSGGFKLFSKIGLTRLRSAQSDDGSSNNESEAGSSTSSASTASSTPTQPEHSSLPPKPKPSATITSFSQRFQSFTSAAKDAVSQGANSSSRSKSSPHLTSPVPVSTVTDGLTEERLVGEEEWVEVCLRTREALEKSLAYKEVVFQRGSMGILLQKSKNNKVFQAVVDSIVPESQASESQQMERGDLLVSINGQSMANVAFLSVIELVKDARRPVVLRFENPNKKKAMETFDAISLPPLAPTLVSATRHSIGIAWNKLPLPNIRYHLQYAKQSEFNFNPWVSVTMKQQDGSSSDLSVTGITELTNGMMVGLDPGQSFVFRVRCGNGEKWGPYSLSSNPISTLEDSTDDSSEDGGAGAIDSTEESRPTCDHSNAEPVFIPGACPEIVERGLFYYRVTISLRARKRPAFDAEKLDIVLEKGAVIKCTERLVAPGTNQIFVRISNDDACVRGDGKEDVDEVQHVSDAGSEEDDAGVWAFENTPEGAVVLERLPEYTEDDDSVDDEPLSVTPPTSFPLPEQAKSMVSSFFSGSGAKSTASSSTVTTDTNSTSSTPLPRAVVVHVAPKILQVFPVSSTSIAVTWDSINDIGITKYQIQYSKNRLAAMWWNANQEIEADTLKYTVPNLMPNTPYLFRIRGCSSDAGWGPYSEASESCRTLPVEETKSSLVPPDSTSGKSEASDEMNEDQMAGSRTNSGNFRLPGGSIFSAPSNTPLRTGSTLLDKAVSVASRLTSRRRSLSSSTSATSSGVSAKGTGTEDEQQEDELESDHMIEDDNGITYVNLGHWKRDTNGSFKDFRFYTAAQYKPSPRSEVASGEPVPAGSSLDKVGERDVVVTPTSIFVLNAWASKREGYAVLEQSRMLDSLVKITTQKSIQNLIVFHFKKEIRVEGDESQVSSAVSQESDATRKEASDAGSEATSPNSDGDGEVMTMQPVEAQGDATTPRKKTEKLFFVVQDADACVALVRQYYEQLISS
ncbi:Tbc1 domain family member related, partial [Globisporangium splendens]